MWNNYRNINESILYILGHLYIVTIVTHMIFVQLFSFIEKKNKAVKLNQKCEYLLLSRTWIIFQKKSLKDCNNLCSQTIPVHVFNLCKEIYRIVPVHEIWLYIPKIEIESIYTCISIKTWNFLITEYLEESRINTHYQYIS